MQPQGAGGTQEVGWGGWGAAGGCGSCRGALLASNAAKRELAAAAASHRFKPGCCGRQVPLQQHRRRAVPCSNRCSLLLRVAACVRMVRMVAAPHLHGPRPPGQHIARHHVHDLAGRWVWQRDLEVAWGAQGRGAIGRGCGAARLAQRGAVRRTLPQACVRCSPAAHRSAGVRTARPRSLRSPPCPGSRSWAGAEAFWSPAAPSWR